MDSPEIREDDAVLCCFHSGVLGALPAMDIEMEKYTKRGHDDLISDHCDRSGNEGQDREHESEDWKSNDQANGARLETPLGRMAEMEAGSWKAQEGWYQMVAVV